MKKRVTMKDIAELLGLSVNAVSLALNDRAGVSGETRRQVLNMAEELGYLDQSSKYTVTYSNKNICVLLEYRFFSDMQFYGKILLGLEEGAKRAGYDLFINSFEKNQNIPSCVEQKKVSGLVVVGKIADDFLKRLKSYSIPVLLLDYESLEEPTDSIMTNNLAGSFNLTRYLLEEGYRKIGFFGSLDYTPSIRERFWGYEEAVQEYLKLDSFDACITYVKRFSVLSEIEDCVIRQDAAALGACFSALEEKPEAIICSNDKMAILLCKALGQLGYRVPDEVSVVGFDDIELSNMVEPRITTMRVNKELMGKKAIERLLRRIENPKEKVEKLVLNVELIERDSVKHLK